MSQSLAPWNPTHNVVKPASEIFVVDDDEDVRDLLSASLESEGFSVTAFSDGDGFLRAAETRVPICIFLDVIMPKRSGLEILQELRARQYWTPIYLVSALDDVATAVEGMKNGAHDYIRKPFDRYAPVLRVRNAVEAWSRRERESQAFDPYANANCEWFRLTPREREMLLLTRLIQS
jgi:FixJ family two-component response regulator